MVRDGVDELSAEVSRVADRLRTLGHARLSRPLRENGRAAGASWAPAGSPRPVVVPRAAGTSVADAAHTLAQQLADLAAGAEGRHRLAVPRLGDHAVGDQVAVTGNDLVALASAGRLDPERLHRAVELLRELRLALP